MKLKSITRITSLLAATVLIAISGFNVSADSEIFIKVDGLLRDTYAKPVIIEDYTMVGLREVSEILGAKVEWDEKVSKAIIYYGNRKIVVTPGEKTAVVSYRDRIMPIAPVIINDRVMVPLRFVSEAFSYVVSWNGDTRTVDIDSLKKDFSVLDSRTDTNPPDDAVKMTYAEALERIASNNTSLNNMKDSLVLLERSKKDTDDAADKANLRLEFGFENVYNWDEINLLRSKEKINNQLMTMRTNEKILRDADEARLRNALTTLTKNDLDIYLLGEQIKRDEQELINMNIKLGLGMETESAITAKKNSIEKSKISVSNLEIMESNNRLALSNLLHLPVGSYVVVKDYAPLTTTQNLEEHITERLTNATGIVLNQIALDDVKFIKHSYEDLLLKDLQSPDYKDEEKPNNEITMENDILSAQRALDDTKLQLEKTIRSSYNTIMQLDEGYASAQVDLESATNVYRDTCVNFIAGYATRNDVKKAQMGILNAEASMAQNRVSYDMAVYAYNNPSAGGN